MRACRFQDGRLLASSRAGATTTSSNAATSTTNKPTNANSLFQPFVKKPPDNNNISSSGTNIIITAAADDTTASAPARQLPSPRTRADTTQRSLQHADAADAASRSPRHRLISPGASPTSSQHELFLSPSGSMSGSTESNQSSQIIELPPLGADPETVSHSYQDRESLARDRESLTPRP